MRRGSGNVGASGMRGSTNVGSKYDGVADMEPRKAPGGGTVLLTLEKYPDGRPSLVRAGVGNIAVFGMSGSVHDRRPRNAPAGVICTRVPWSSHTIVVVDLRDASTAALTVTTRDASPAALPVSTPSQIRGGHWFCAIGCCTTGNLLASVVAKRTGPLDRVGAHVDTPSVSRSVQSYVCRPGA